MKKIKGFTLIELLVVIAIIGLLSSVALSSLGSSRVKAKRASFRTEMKSLLPKIIIDCGSAVFTTAAAEVPSLAGHYTTTETSFAQSCGSNGAGTFVIKINAANGAVDGSSADCVATMTEKGATFSTGC